VAATMQIQRILETGTYESTQTHGACMHAYVTITIRSLSCSYHMAMVHGQLSHPQRGILSSKTELRVARDSLSKCKISHKPNQISRTMMLLRDCTVN
jgi:hypothetical protein